MSFSTKAVATALRLITKYGKKINFTVVTQTAYDPTTGAAGTTEVMTAIKGLVSDYNKMADGAAFVSGLVQEGDKKITLAGASLLVVPKPSDKVSFDTSVMTVLNVKATFAGEVAALYELHVRN